ncbi:hypothetical protein EI94DRAFT_631820 [Lactarius quietus]|nr:hypothetical protein EI94DRAFT_631820 [Lactarius quietus]
MKRKREDDDLFEDVKKSIINMYPCEKTVDATWKRLLRYHFVWAQAPPGSGKTILAKLLAVHARAQLGEVKVILLLSRWKLPSEGWLTYLKNKGWEGFQSKAVLIFDEGQTTYKDGDLWDEFFKVMASTDSALLKTYVIGFAAYGNTTWFTGGTTPFPIPQGQRISLQAIDHRDGLPAAGVLFTKEEFDGYVGQISAKEESNFEPSFFDHLFEPTGGHIGAIVSIKMVVENTNEYRGTRSGTQTYDWDAFEKYLPPNKLVDLLQFTSVFGRGLPNVKTLQDWQITNALSTVAQKSHVQSTEETEDIRKGLEICARNGWLASDPGNVDGSVCYSFASKLHQWWVQWKLFMDDRWAGNVEEDDIFDFAQKVLRRFDPRAFTGQRAVNDSGAVQQIPEAQYPDEFYRCCHDLYPGSAVVFPEFGTKRGRVDFYVKSRKWAIELVRDGDQLQRHVDRFLTTSRYGELPIEDFLVLDCRNTIPEKPHPNLVKLFHVYFTDGYKSVQILDCKLNMVKEFGLVNH